MAYDFSDAIPVSSIAEEYKYLEKIGCPACGGLLGLEKQILLEDKAGRHYDLLVVRCRDCGHQTDFLFDIHSFFGRL
ncbi:MAG: hypothetical protein H5T64_04360 [Chloroflexi bacterium]|nr:hypothetical protein [Chloroflexota bacterium]